MKGYAVIKVVFALVALAATECNATSTSDIKFLLFTQTNARSPTEIIPNNDTTLGNYNAINENKILIHGFSRNGSDLWMHQLKDVVLQQGPMNVVIVDWGKLVTSPNYPIAVLNAKVCGNYIASLIRYFIDKGSSLNNTHLIGQSLGAHAAGLAGSALNGQVGRISGLDPAGPFFNAALPSERLDKSDALFVDIIHGNAGLLAEGHMGIIYNVGHVDVWVNGGKKQPGCNDILQSLIGLTFSCSHNKPQFHYIESAKYPDAFTSYKCSDYTAYRSGACVICDNDTCNKMGYWAKKEPSGVFYLTTHENSPYAGKQVFVDLNVSQSQSPSHGHIYLTLNSENGSDTGEIIEEGGSFFLSTSKRYNSVIAIFSNLTDFTGGSVKYVPEGATLTGAQILPPILNSPAKIAAISVFDPQTNQRKCMQDNEITVQPNTTVPIALINC